MIVAVAVCPGAPLLIAGVAERLAGRVPDVDAACDDALAGLAVAERLLIVAGPPGRTSGCSRARRILEPGTPVVGWGFGRGNGSHSVLRAAGRPSGDEAPTLGLPSTAVGLALLARHAPVAPTWVLELDADGDAIPFEPAEDGHRWGLLVLADGAARHGGDAPGRADDRAAAFDAGVAAALEAGEPGELLSAIGDPRRPADELLAGCASLDLLARWTTAQPPAGAILRYAAAPFGVGYLAASWFWDLP
jgi:hypothetical protein